MPVNVPTFEEVLDFITEGLQSRGLPTLIPSNPNHATLTMATGDRESAVGMLGDDETDLDDLISDWCVG
jgi:hypothetical protein